MRGGCAVFLSASLGCGCCGNGLVAFVLAADGRRVVMFCLNCGTWYPTPDHDADGDLLDGADAGGEDLVLSGAGCSVRFPPARWATADEVTVFGWGEYLDPSCPAGNPWLPEREPWWEKRIRGDN
jgi:hypothetical protein